ncbi:MAG: diguanylate cyclase [bacterium]
MRREDRGSKPSTEIDRITGLYQENYFLNNILDDEISRAKRHHLNFSLARINLENFSQLSDSYGKEMENQFLSEVGDVLIKRCRFEEPIARYEDNNFLFLLIGTDENGAFEATRRMRRVILESACITRAHNLGVTVTISAGAATFPKHGQEKKALISKAGENIW